jgi:hypothetical protein
MAFASAVREGTRLLVSEERLYKCAYRRNALNFVVVSPL